MTSKWSLRSGTFVAILAQCAVFAACEPDGPPVEGDGGAGGAAAGDGDAGTGGEEPAGTGGVDGGNDCGTLLIVHPIHVHVLGGWQETEQQCRATAALTFEGETHELSCSASGSDCSCGAPPALGIPREGVTLTVSDGDTVLFEQSDLQDRGQCEGVSFGTFEVDYIEALGEAVNTLSDATQELASPEPCATEADCEAVPLGAKACGGPWSYIVASTQSATYSDVVALSEELERIERLHGELAELTSDCAYVVAPDVACEEGVCVAISPD